MQPDDAILDLLDEWERQYEVGVDVSPQALSPDPLVASELGVLIEQLKRTRAALGASARPIEPLPETADGYETRSLLGQGGIGVVYLCADRELGRPVAIKWL